jgi:hypothetical protein
MFSEKYEEWSKLKDNGRSFKIPSFLLDVEYLGMYSQNYTTVGLFGVPRGQKN